ncbi:MAG: thiol peroxidase [Chloroflexi bacterium]|nr:thiol peroxidase [Chloroflexota bacterium]MCL5276128.1 thiol peroxidase [Chloroflexota bacterium]
MSTERPGAVTLKGAPLTVVGNQLKVGDQFPDVTLVAPDWNPVKLSAYKGAVCLISVAPSLDTGICDAQTRRFDQEAAAMPQAKFITVSADLPWAQRNWAGQAEAKNVTILSDHHDMAFGDAVGVHVKEMRIDQRSVFVVDREGALRYAEYAPEIAQHPNYDAALDAVKQLL